MPWLPTLGRALNPAAYSGDSTGDREADSSICDLSPLVYPIIPLLSCNLDLPSINWSFFRLIAGFAHYNHVHAILVLTHKINKLQPDMPNK